MWIRIQEHFLLRICADPDSKHWFIIEDCVECAGTFHIICLLSWLPEPPGAALFGWSRSRFFLSGSGSYSYSTVNILFLLDPNYDFKYDYEYDYYDCDDYVCEDDDDDE